jgi:hypothetical protein
MADETTPAAPPSAPTPPPDILAGAPVLAIIPHSIDEVLRYAKMVIAAGAVPDSLAKDGSGRPYPVKELISRVVTVIAAGSEVGLPPMRSLANIALINKRAQIWGEAAVALLQASGKLEEMVQEHIGQEPDASTPTVQFHDTYGWRIILKRKGQPSPYIGVFTVGQAKRAHLWANPKKTPWVEYPERQLFWRAFHQAATDGFADALCGLGIREIAEEDQPAPIKLTDTSFLEAGPLKPTPVKEPGADDPDEGEDEDEPDEEQHDD